MAPGQVRGSWNKRKVQRTSHLLMDELDEDTSPDFLPHGKKRHTGRVSHKVAQQPTVYTQPNQKLRGTRRCSNLQANCFYTLLL